MGYSTEYTGTVTVNPPLGPVEIAYLNAFSETRRMQRSNGPYFVEGSGPFGQGRDGDVLDSNAPAAGQPGLWCNWVPTEDGSGIEWNGVEKFYYGREWMQYLIDHFLKAGGEAKGQPGFEGFTFDHVLNGVLDAQGDESDDAWQLTVADNLVSGDSES